MHPRILIVKILRFFKLNKIVAHIYYGYFHGFNSIGKELPGVIERCLSKAKEFGTSEIGDYYEFGIFKGHTFSHAYKFAERNDLNNMRFFGFDSFQGLPDIVGLDVTEEMPFYKGQYSAEKTKVVNNINNAGIDWSKAFLIEGFFDDSLNNENREKYKMNKISVALIDCDLHSSTVDVLNFIKDMLVDNSILIFDDWNTFNEDNERGQRKAFGDFIAANEHITAEKYFNYGAYGKAFIIRHKQN